MLPTAFDIENFRPVFWYLKFVIDLALLAFAACVIVVSIPLSGTKANDSGLEFLKYFADVLTGLMLTVPLVLATEFAWASHRTVMNNDYVFYVRGTSTLAINSFDNMLFGLNSPSYLARIALCLINAPYFVFLPIVMIVQANRNTQAWIHWVCFVPSILLSFSLYPLLVILVENAKSVSDIFFAIASVLVFSKLSNSIEGVALSRTKSIGQIHKNYTDPAAGVAKLIIYILGQLADTGEVDINFQEQSICTVYPLPELFLYVIDCIECYAKDCVIRLANIPHTFDEQDELEKFIRLIDAVAKSVQYRISVEIPAKDVTDGLEHYDVLRVIGEAV